MSSYVKYMEASGARVVPILYNESKESIDSKLSQLDGILFPGGDGDNYDLGLYVFE
jgi:gamma-glutamyl hydrolase